MKQLEAERTLHSQTIQDLRKELKTLTSQKNERIGKLISELYSANKSVKDLSAELETAKSLSMDALSKKRTEERLFIQEEVASTLKNVIESVVSDKKDSVETLRLRLRKEEELTRDLEKLIQELKDEKNELRLAYESTKEELLLNKSRQVEKEQLDKAIDNLKKEVHDKEIEVSHLTSQLSQSKNDFDKAVNSFNRERDDLQSCLAKEQTSKEDELSRLKLLHEKDVQNAIQKLETGLKEEFATQLSNILNEKDELKTHIDSLGSQLQNLNETLNATRREKEELEESLKKKGVHESSELKHKVSSLESEANSLRAQLEESKKEQEHRVTELQKEMETYNQSQNSLKDLLLTNDLQTEEVIPTLRAHFEKFHRVSENLYKYELEVESLRKSIQEYEASTRDMEKENECKLFALAEEKNKELSDLRSQLANVSRKDLSDGMSEVASTCSISRNEEQDRLADCEGYFEERYAKLKILAVKLKRKVVELEALRKTDKEKILATNNNLSSVQSAFDKMGEELQEKKSLIKLVESDLKKSVEDLLLSKQKILELQDELSAARADNQSLTSKVSDSQSKFEILNVEFRSLKEKDEQNGEFISELKQSLESYKAKEDLLDKAESLDSELGISLKKINTLENSNKTKEEHIQTLELKLEEESKASKKLKGDLITLECSLKDETDNSECIQQKLKDCSRKLTSLENELSSKDLKLSEMKNEMMNLTQENESFKSRLQSDSISAAEQIRILKDKNGSVQQALSSLKEEINMKNTSLEKTEKALAELQKEFNSYKLRAQSVLRQSKSTKESESSLPGISESKAMEANQYERTIQQLNDKIEVLRNKLASSELDKNHLQEDHDRLMQRHSSLLDEMAAKEIASRVKQDELSALLHEAKASIEDLSTKSKLNLEEKIQFYENTIQTVRSNNAEDISRLQKQVDELNNQNIMLQLSMSQMEEQIRFSSGSKEVSPWLEKREAPEGSVEMSNGRHSRQSPSTLAAACSNCDTSGDRSPMPLEQLLESEPTDRPKEHEKIHLVRDEEAIKALERKIGHLSGLLSDSESENHRMAELVEALKEEIRTYRRSEDRIKHIEHQEYVKNVILKFLTMSENAGRRQLLPIVSKLLVLSPEEVKTIENMLNEPDTTSKEQSSGWPSYLGYLMSSDP